MLPDQPSARDRPWYIAQRWQEYDAERRANLLRIVGIGSLYLVHLMHYHGLGIGALQLADEGSVRWQFHVQVTLLVVIWTMLALGMLLALQQRIFPRWLKLFSTAAACFAGSSSSFTSSSTPPTASPARPFAPRSGCGATCPSTNGPHYY